MATERPSVQRDFVHDGKKYRLILSVNRSERRLDRYTLAYIKANGRVWAFDHRTGRYDNGLGGGSAQKSFKIFVEGGKLRLSSGGAGGAAGFSGIDGWQAGVDIAVTPPHETQDAPAGLTIKSEQVDIHSTIKFNLFSATSDSEGERTFLEAVETKLSWKASLDSSSPSGFRFSDQETALREDHHGEQGEDDQATAAVKSKP